MSWVSQFINHNRGFIGNAAKNISPFLALTPLGIPGALAAGALGRAIQPGAKLGDIAKSGLSNAGIGAGMQGGMAALRSAFAPSSSAAGAVYGSGGAGGGSEIGGQVMGVGNGFTAGAHAVDAPGGMSLADKVGGALKGVGKFASDHPKALEMGMTAFDPTQRNYMRAQTDAITTNTQMSRDEQERRRRQQEALAPVWAAFMGQLQNAQSHPYQVAPNPYGGGR